MSTTDSLLLSLVSGLNICEKCKQGIHKIFYGDNVVKYIENIMLNDHMDCMKCFLESDIVTRYGQGYKKHCDLAARKGNYKFLKFFHKKGLGWNENLSEEAVVNDSLDCLRYTIKNGCILNETVIKNAYEYNSINCLLYLLVNNCPVRDYDNKKYRKHASFMSLYHKQGILLELTFDHTSLFKYLCKDINNIISKYLIPINQYPNNNTFTKIYKNIIRQNISQGKCNKKYKCNKYDLRQLFKDPIWNSKIIYPSYKSNNVLTNDTNPYSRYYYY